MRTRARGRTLRTRPGGTDPGVGAVFRAETLKLRRRPAIWIVLGVAVLLLVVYLYAGFYVKYLQEVAGVMLPDVEPQFVLQGLLPDQVVQALLWPPAQTWDIYAIGLVLGALVAGSEYGWGTLKMEAAQGPSRLALYLGQLLALAALLVILVPLLFALALGASLIVAALQQQSVGWLSAGQLLAGMGAAFLLFAMPATLGMMFATLLCSAPLGIGAGMAWLFLIEEGLQIFDSSSPVLIAVVDWLPRANADSLAALFGAWAASQAPPPHPAQGDAVHVVAALVVYIIAFSAVGTVVFRHRDVA